MLRRVAQVRKDPIAFLTWVRHQYGDVAQLPIPNPPTYLVTDPEAVRRVLVTNARAYGKRTIQYTTLSLVTGEGLLTADTEAWRPARRMLQPAFHRETLALVGGHVTEAVDRLLARWAAQDGQVVDVDEAMMRVGLEVVGSSLFGSDLSADAERLAAATVRALDVVIKKARTPLPVPLSVPTPSNVVLRRAVGQLDAAVTAMLAERATRPLAPDQAPRDLLDLLLLARDDVGEGLSPQQIRDQVVTFIVAGHETVAAALTWALDLLATHPEALRRVRAEADALGRAPQLDDIASLPYTAAVLDETLRLYPPAWVITRRATEADVLADVEIPADALLILSPWLVHRHETAWQRPEEFEPERFLDADGRRRRDVATAPAYLPFGAGPRLCIGRDMALLEGVVVLASLARAVDLEPVGPSPTPVPLVTVRPRGGLPMRVRSARR